MTSRDPESKSQYEYEWESLRLGQIRRLVMLRQFGQHSTEKAKIDASTLSRELSRIETKFGIGNLNASDSDNRILSFEGELLAQAFQPALDFCVRLGNGEIRGSSHDRRFRVGSGGSLASWLIGSRLKKMREHLNKDQEDIPADKLPSTPRIEVEVYRNRVTALSVASGALDCGLVREGVLDKRLRLKSKQIGIVTYFLYVPKDWFRKELKDAKLGKLDFEVERKILETGPVATVGPDGEFRVKLNEAMADRGVTANIELQYRAFPMLIPHMMKKSHVVIMPDIQQLGGEEPAGYLKFRLGLLEEYRRRIFMIARQDHNEVIPWMNFDGLAKALTF